MTSPPCPCSFHILGCTALLDKDAQADPHIREGYRWLIDTIDSIYGSLGPRVVADAARARAEAAQKKAERVARGARARAEREAAQVRWPQRASLITAVSHCTPGDLIANAHVYSVARIQNSAITL